MMLLQFSCLLKVLPKSTSCAIIKYTSQCLVQRKLCGSRPFLIALGLGRIFLSPSMFRWTRSKCINVFGTLRLSRIFPKKKFGLPTFERWFVKFDQLTNLGIQFASSEMREMNVQVAEAIDYCLSALRACRCSWMTERRPSTTT